MKKFMILFAVLMLVSGSLFADPTSALLTINSNVPGAFLVRFNALDAGEGRTISPQIVHEDITDVDNYGTLLDTVDTETNLRVLAVSAWTVEATINHLEHQSTDSYITFDLQGMTGSVFAESNNATLPGWSDPTTIVLENLQFFDSLENPGGDYPLAGDYNGEIIFTVSSN